MGDIGGAAQATANVADTMMIDATNIELQQHSNAFNAAEAEKARAFNAQQAGITRGFDASQSALNRSFQAQQQTAAEAYNTAMSNTAVQRRAEDIKSAGFNPLLGIGALGGASSPTMSAPSGSAIGGPAASGPAATSVGLSDLRPITGGLSGALTAGKQQDLLAAQTRNINVDTSRKTAELPYAASQASATVENLRSSTNQLMAQAMELSSRYNLNQQNAYKVLQDKNFARELFPLVKQAQELDIQAKQFGLPELSTRSDFWKSGLAAPIYAGQQGGVAGGTVGAAAATAAWVARQAASGAQSQAARSFPAQFDLANPQNTP